MEVVLANFAGIARNPYGNYVVQCLAVHGWQQQRHRVLPLIGSGLRSLAGDAFGCAVP